MFAMFNTPPRLRLIGMVIGLGIATTACTDGYGYSGVELGYADPYYGGGYGDYDGGYGNTGYGYGAYGGFGWYGDYYYPGTGIYVYDRNRRPYRWNDRQRSYWEGRRGNDHGDGRGHWGGFAGAGNRGAAPGTVAQPGGNQGLRGDRSLATDRQAFRGSEGARTYGNRQGFIGGGARSGGNTGGRGGFGGGRGGGRRGR